MSKYNICLLELYLLIKVNVILVKSKFILEKICYKIIGLYFIYCKCGWLFLKFDFKVF